MPRPNDAMTLLTEIKESFRGPSRGLILIAWGEALGLAALAIWSAIQFFRVDSTRDLIFHATLFLAAFIATVAVKLWYHNWLNRAAILRRIASLERQITPPN